MGETAQKKQTILRALADFTLLMAVGYSWMLAIELTASSGELIFQSGLWFQTGLLWGGYIASRYKAESQPGNPRKKSIL